MIKISFSFNPLKIFISSSWTDDSIKEELKKIEEVFIPNLYLKLTKGDLGSDDSTRLHSLKIVGESNIIIIILGKKFSEIVVDEYNEAKENDIPILVFVKNRLEMEKNLQIFFENIKNERTYRRFESLDELKEIMSKTIINLISEKFRQYQVIYKVILELLSKYIFKIPKRLLDKLSKLNE